MSHRILMGLSLLVVVLVGCSFPDRLTAPVATSVPAAATPSTPAAQPTEVVITLPLNVPRVDWQRCPNTEGLNAVLQCGQVNVPLDYAHPDGETLAIHFIRRPAGASGASNGTILLNPGGPGESGIAWMLRSNGGWRLSEALGISDFDLVSFDPRGTGASGGLFCQSDAEIDRYRYPDTTPDTPAEVAFLAEARHAFARQCRETYGDTLQHYSTVNTARDMDMIRRALRVEQISYIGFSYGTFVGGVYAHVFPDRVRAMVLDAALQPVGDTIEQRSTTQLGGFGSAMKNWITWCETPANQCAFEAADVGARWDALWEQFDATPVTSADGRVANQATIADATTRARSSAALWPMLGTMLVAAENGDTTALWRLVDSFDHRSSTGHYDAAKSAFPVTLCASGIVADPAADPAGLLVTLKTLSPHFTKDLTAEQLAEPDDCQTLLPNAPISPVSNRANAPVLVIGTENDPATPMRWAEQMTEDLGPNARLIRYSGEGHTVLGTASCVDTVARRLLRDAEIPDAGVVCAPDPDLPEPSWWQMLPLPGDSIATFDASAIAEITGIQRRAGYGTGYLYTGSTAEGVAAVTAALSAAGFDQPIEFFDYEGAQSAWYSDGAVSFTIVVAGSDGITATDELGLARVVPPGQGLVYFLFLPQ